MNKEKLQLILDKHSKWLNGEDGGEKADLFEANLRGVDFGGANLRGADFGGANLRGANLRGADLREVNLRWADLGGADLFEANLRGANLRGTCGELRYLKTLILESYPVTYTSAALQIGCERHAIGDWWDFDDARILEMDGKAALKFWRKYKDFIKQAIELSPAEPTGYTEGKQ